jgi:pantothenate kinase
MNYTTAIFLINKNVRAILCNYEPDAPDKKVIFKTLDATIREGDFVVVPTKTRHGMTVSKVVETDVDIDFDSATPTAWVVSRIDQSAYEATIAQEADAITVIKSAEKTKKRNELAAALLVDSKDALKALPIYVMNGDNQPLPESSGAA